MTYTLTPIRHWNPRVSGREGVLSDATSRICVGPTRAAPVHDFGVIWRRV